MAESRQNIDTMIALGVSVLVFIVYCLTLSVGAYPGQFAFYLTQDMGLFPRNAPDRPLWALVSLFLSRLSFGGDSALPFNLFSAICGAVGVFVIYWVARNAIVLCFHDDREDPQKLLAARLAGAAAGGALGFCSAYWTTATRGHWSSFQVFMLLFAAWLFFKILKNGGTRGTLIFCFLYGLGVVEYPTFIVFAPLFVSGLLLSIWRRKQLTPRYCVAMVGCAFAGLLLYVPAAAAFYHSPGYELKEYGGFHEVIWFMWRDQWWLISRGLPQQGWLLVLILTAVPWLTGLAVAKRALGGEQDWSFRVLHVVITGVVIAVLLNAKIAPWSMLGTAKLLVFPYVLIASLFGYLVAYWFFAPGTWVESTAKRRKAATMGRVLAITAFLFVCWLPFRNFADGNGRHAGAVREFANDVIRSMGEKTWLITTGVWDPHLQIAADEQRKTVRLLDISRAHDEQYHVYLSRFFESPKLKSRLRIGLMPMLREWAVTDADFESKCAAEGHPDVWIGLGFSPVPNLLVFDGTRDTDQLDPDKLMGAHERFWSEFTLDSSRVEKMGPLVRLGRQALRQAAMGANNLGVLMEDLGRADFAFKAYRQASEIDGKNVSALLNMNTMIQRGYSTSLQQEVESRLTEFSSELAGYRSRQISSFHGYIRSPEAYADMGWAWARSATPGRSIPLLLKALELQSPEGSLGVKQTLADVYRLEGLDDEGRALYYEILVGDPDSPRALIGMARLEMNDGNRVEARKYLEKVEKAGIHEALKSMEWATYHILDGDNQRAVELLQGVLKTNPERVRAWSMLVNIYIQEDDEEGLRQCAEKLRRLPTRNRVLPLVEGHLARMQYDFEHAIRAFEEALTHMPNDLRILEWLLRIEAALQRDEAMTARARQILYLDPDHILANRLLGSFLVSKKKYQLAADSIDRARKQSGNKDPMTLNDLAWVLQESELFADAEQYARQALDLDDKLAPAWDTLGVILMKTDRLKDAREAFSRALDIDDKHVAAALHLAEAQLAAGDLESASALLEKWASYRDTLSPSAATKLDELISALR